MATTLPLPLGTSPSGPGVQGVNNQQRLRARNCTGEATVWARPGKELSFWQAERRGVEPSRRWRSRNRGSAVLGMWHLEEKVQEGTQRTESWGVWKRVFIALARGV